MGETVATALQRLRANAAGGLTADLSFREAQLDGLEAMLAGHEAEFTAALAADLGKPAPLALLTEVLSSKAEVRVQRRGLRRWARPRRARLPLVLQPARATLRHEPLGIVAIVAPWNYPLNLVVAPAAAALAAGNCVVVKPSELAPATSSCLAELLPRHVDRRVLAVCEGGAEVATAIVDGGVDHLFFTGSTAVGRLVGARAAAYLTPVTLELGGKSPVYVDERANLGVAARRIAWGKFLNAGQTCIAPDYVLVHRAVADDLVAALAGAVSAMFGERPQLSASYGRIVDGSHLDRLVEMLEKSGGRVVAGGEYDREARYLAPTIVVGVEPDSPLAREEIFGPVLPVVSVEGLEEALSEIATHPSPLCAYVFSEDRAVITRFVETTRSGSVAANTTMEQFAAPSLPFGGLGESGSGRYHGRFGFETFSQLRPVLQKATRPQLQIAYPPYSPRAIRLFRRLL